MIGCSAMATVVTLLIVALGVYLVFFVFFPLGRGAIYDPSTSEETRQMARACRRPSRGEGGRPRIRGRAGGDRARHEGSGSPRLRGEPRPGGDLPTQYPQAGAPWSRIHPLGQLLARNLSRYNLITVFQVGFVMARPGGKAEAGACSGSPCRVALLAVSRAAPEEDRGSIYRYRIG